MRATPEEFDRFRGWLERHERSTLFIGRITPLVRSFISIPAGVLRTGLGNYTLYTLLGSLVWCAAFAALGWSLAGGWQSFHHNFRYADYVAVLAVAGLIAVAVLRASRRRGRHHAP